MKKALAEGMAGTTFLSYYGIDYSHQDGEIIVDVEEDGNTRSFRNKDGNQIIVYDEKPEVKADGVTLCPIHLGNSLPWVKTKTKGNTRTLARYQAMEEVRESPERKDEFSRMLKQKHRAGDAGIWYW